MGFILDFTEPNVCVDENLRVDDSGLIVMQPWSVPRLVADVKCVSGGDGKMFPEIALPGRLMKDQKVRWRNDSPLAAMVIVRITRASKSWVTSNPNAIQFRDRYTYVIDPEDKTPTIPVTTGIHTSKCGSAIDVGTNASAEPLPGRHWMWTDLSCLDEWIGPVPPGDFLNLWYREYVWTPEPWSDNANKNAAQHEVYSGSTRIQFIAMPQQGELVTG